ncbi:MAG: CRISPR-associated protein Cas4 [Anaerolineae bacterium]|nr:CRISPR-associated protein Cas4 [Anaerolineae bacterium]
MFAPAPSEAPDYLPISYLNQVVYCPRRFWLMYYQSEWESNAPVLEGQIRHTRAHQSGIQRDDQGRVLRSVHVWSAILRIAGVTDFIEEQTAGDSVTLIPLEHKHGKMGNWLSDHVQLCAQALCLEERTGTAVPQGEIFYWGSRRRERVAIDEGLRERTRAAIRQAFALLEAGKMPSPIDHPGKCHDCSLEPICLPRETLKLRQEE